MKISRTLTAVAAATVVAAGSGLWHELRAGAAPQGVQPHPQPSKGDGANASAFTIDSVHSSVIFKIQHMGLANFYGRFNDISGTYHVDSADPAKSSFDIQVKTESVDTANTRRDGHLKSPDFFNAAEYPTISFKSNSVTKGAEGMFVANGTLTLHGVSKPLTANIQVTPAKQTQQGFKNGFETTFTIKRSDFGMNYGVSEGALGDDVMVTVSVEGARK